MQSIIAIDVSKHELVIYANETYFNINNSKQSLQKWFKSNQGLMGDGQLFVYEATGGYERTLAHFLHENQLPGRCVHANHVRAYARSAGILAKTDKLDVKVISEYAQSFSVLARTTVAKHERLTALTDRREQLIVMKKQENSRLETLCSKEVIKDIKQHIKQLDKRLQAISNEMKAYIAADKALTKLVKTLSSIPGVSFITSVSVIVYLPEIVDLDDKSVSALAGLAPMNRDSGGYRGKRKIQGGRAQIRRVLYMAAISAIRWNAELKLFYERLIKSGKIFKVAITAVMRKLLLLIQVVAKRQTPWETRLSLT